jgi:SAM-dependent methyltransferase
MPNPLYDAAEAYDLAFDFHDLGAEASALAGWSRRVLGHEPRSYLELACGPAYAGVELARRGASVVALDLSEAMCEKARSRARAASVPLEVVRGDMNALELGRTFDVALCLTESLAHVRSVKEMIAHLGGVARHLVPGGVYVVEQLHPRDTISPEAWLDWPWAIEREGVRATAHWGFPDDPWDPITQLRDVTVSIALERAGKIDEAVHERVRVKLWTATEMEAVILASGAFELVERHGDFALDAPFDNTPASWRMITVLRKKT